MTLIDITIGNLRRRRTKFIFLVVGLVIAVGTVVTLVSVVERMNAEIANSLDEFGANILILPKSDDLSLTYGGMSVSGVSFDVRTLRDEDANLIRTIKNRENISIVAPKLLTAARVNERDVLVVGVDFVQEFRLKKWWSMSGRRPVTPDEAIVGAEAKTKLGLTLGQNFELNREAFTVAGILGPTGSQDDGIVFIDLQKARLLFGKTAQLSLIEVAALCYDCPIDLIVSQMAEKLPGAKVMAIRQAIESKMETMHRFEHFSLGISLVVLVVGALIVFTSMTASVNERTREIGIFRAVGFRQSDVMKMILMEAFMTSTVAGLIGYFVGILVTRFISPMFGMAGNTPMSVTPALLGISIALSAVIGIGASLYPAVKASRLDPSVALKAL